MHEETSKEKRNINYNIKTQYKLKDTILLHIQDIGDSTDIIDTAYVETVVELLEKLKTALALCNKNISLLMTQKKSLNNNENIDDKNLNYTVLKNTFKIQECLYDVSLHLKLKFSKNETNIEKPQANTTSDSKETSPGTDYTENTLIISEISGKVFLPYSLSVLKQKLKNNTEKYSNINDIIDADYTLPLSQFKNTSISRFKEAFKLMRTKEKSTIKAAFDLGMELLFNYNLHPAIITACKDLNELDIYLAYLETGETHKFDCFKIVFNMAPSIVK